MAPHVKALVVPGSKGVRQAAEQEGLDEVFRDAGFEWRGAGCSMCLAMNPDRLEGRQVCASSSNRNFKGRQGSPTGRTLLMSPAMVAAAAVMGEVTDVRKMLGVTVANGSRPPLEGRSTGWSRRERRGLGCESESHMTDDKRRIDRLEGTGIPIRGNNIDTDRIIPARYLKAVTFEGLGEHVFEDDRKARPDHPVFEPPVSSAPPSCWPTRISGPGPRVSTRRRRSSAGGSTVCVGESFSEIFRGNALAIGVPCATAEPYRYRVRDAVCRTGGGHPHGRVRV